MNEFSKSSTIKQESKVRSIAKSFNPATNPTKTALGQDTFHSHKTPIMFNIFFFHLNLIFFFCHGKM